MMRATMSVVALALVSFGATAQPMRGDFLAGTIGGTGDLLWIDRTTKAVNTLANPVQTGGFANMVMMAADNTDVVFADVATNSVIASVTPGGVVTTLASLVTGSAGAGDVLQSGNYVFQTFNELVELQGGVVTTLIAGMVNFPNAMARDHDRDTILIGFAGTSTLEEWDPRAKSLTTLCTLPSSMGGIDPMPRGVGGLPATAVSSFGSPRVLICSGGAVVTSLTFTSNGSGQALKVDDVTGNIYMASNTGDIYELDPLQPLSPVINTWGNYGVNFTGIEVYGSRRIHGTGTGAPGSPYGITMNFGSTAANAPVFVALAFAQRPGITVPGAGRINLALDTLFLASVQGVLTGTILNGFPAVLDAQGRGGGSILIPGFMPRGLPIYFSAVALVQQSIVEIANTVGIMIQ